MHGHCDTVAHFAYKASDQFPEFRAAVFAVRRKLKIARGQLDGILQMIDDDRYCVDISNQLLATQSLLKSANQQIMRAHIEGCVREALQTDHIDPKLEEAFQLLERMAQS